ncbi:alpha/beta fold hydrolase [Amycolatopsis echigonensis]|uniref:Alpha/beta hydrolase n=1 Tax=Amycolatopsis echigonensis TaxID=2576905 RepID=A0A8E1W2M5_9PSEU|nr:alpha/beta hydrolase [Amycolatopsis echigonensis]MBB2502579.1 alpha/beta hydrolase [Amycolatopsis echigonensis]
MPRVELSAGPIDYTDTGGAGPVLVFGHGFPMSRTQWRKVVPLLDGYRCLLPTLPLGAHLAPMRPDADLSQFGVARLLGEFLAALDLHEATIVLNDWGGGQFLVADGLAPAEHAARVGRLALVACEAFDNFPPKPARPVVNLLRLPGGPWLHAQATRTSFYRHAKAAYGAMCESRVPDDILEGWFAPALRDKEIRRDMVKFATGTPPRRVLLEWTERLRSFDRPVLVVWAGKDRMMPADHGRRLVDLFPDSRLVEIPDSGTLIPEDQPERLAKELTAFLTETGAVPG